MPSAAPHDFLTLQEFVVRARHALSDHHWHYIVGGTETETTVRRNRWAIDRLALRPRVLRDVSELDSSIDWFGHRLRLPVIFAPVGGLEHFWDSGPTAVVQAAGQFGIPHMLSSVCACDPAELARASPAALKLYQLYVHGDSDWIEATLERIAELGFAQVAITVDSAVYSRRERDLAQRYFRRTNVPGREWQARFTWKDVERVRKRFDFPLMLKGIATAEDARIAVDMGIDGVYVSNHGGRQLDHSQGSMEVLPEIVDAVDGKARVIVDGGFCRGSDIVKAIAMGADLVGLGRMQCVALAAGGAPALVRMLELLETEVRIALALCGVTSPTQLDRSYLTDSDAVLSTNTWGAFPMIDRSYSAPPSAHPPDEA